MAERINWKKVDRSDPRFLEADPTNPNKNISASKFDPTDPTAGEGSPGAAYNEFLRTANVGDVFDWASVGQPGIKSKFTGFNKMGTPMIQTIESSERKNWRDQINPRASVAQNLDALTRVGFGRQEAIFMMANSGLVDEREVARFLTGAGAAGGVSGPSNTAVGPDGNVITAPVGTPPAFVYNSTSGKWEMPPKPTSKGSWVWDNTQGWVDTTVNPGFTGQTTEGGPTLAKDTFKNTLALFFGASEMSQPWVDAFYKVVSGYVNTGSTIDESLNLSLQDVRNNPVLAPFTKRFQGLYALQDRLAKGEAVEVPTIAEFFKSESAMGDVLRSVGLGELATQDFLGDVLGRGKSVLEVSNLINSTFKAIDNAPAALKADLQTYFPGVDRTSIAKALLTGKEGWQELDRKVRGISVLSAAKSQGVDVSLASATDIADLGFDYSGALAGFETVKRLERGKMLGEISGMQFGQEQAVGATFKQDVKAKQQIEQLAALEQARFAGSSGRLASRSRAQGAF